MTRKPAIGPAAEGFVAICSGEMPSTLPRVRLALPPTTNHMNTMKTKPSR